VATWLREYQVSREVEADAAMRTWFWLAVGTTGQALFASRFLIQWIATERRRKSVVPPVFWRLSIAAAGLQMSCFLQRAEWIFAVGMAATVLIYARNLWLIREQQVQEQDPPAE